MKYLMQPFKGLFDKTFNVLFNGTYHEIFNRVYNLIFTGFLKEYVFGP